jgi:eukaryotic-like serine/threonine-protein kinase
MLGDFPKPTSIGDPFGFRDYHKGAMRHAATARGGRASVHLSRVYRGTDDKLWKIALSIPVRDGDGDDSPALGVLAATLTTTSTLGSLQLDDGKRTAVLVARADKSSTEEEYLIMLHPAYEAGTKAIALNNPRLELIHRPVSGDEFTLPEPRDPGQSIDLDYHDPVDARQGKWLAGFAPVGNTEYVVIVQQRVENALESDASLPRALLLWGVLALTLGAIGTVVLRGFARRLGR